MTPAEVVIASTEYWEGLYVDGKLVMEGHRVSRDDILRHLVGRSISSYRVMVVNPSWLENRGFLPGSESELKVMPNNELPREGLYPPESRSPQEPLPVVTPPKNYKYHRIGCVGSHCCLCGWCELPGERPCVCYAR